MPSKPPLGSLGRWFFWTFVWTLTIFSVDLYTKSIASAFGLSVHNNNGISFGLLSNSTVNLTLVSLLLLGILLIAGRVQWLKSSFFTGLLVGGAMANGIDRIIFGAVRDWLPVPFFGLYNNCADWAIFIAVCWFVWQTLRSKQAMRQK